MASSETIRLDGIIKSYGEKRALNGVSLEVPSGQVLGYIGPNGAGKTTTVKILTGTLRPDQGHVSVCGFDALKNPIEVKKRVGYVPEVAALFESMTPLEYGRFVGRIQGLEDHILDYRLDSFIRIFGLYDSRNEIMAALSKGAKQKILILTALLHNPPVVILDEPLNGLDANAAFLLKEIIACLSHRGRTIFYCSHLLDVVEKVCHRVVILKEGRILTDGTVEAVRKKAGTLSIEAAFSALTSTIDWAGRAEEFVAALDGKGGE